MTPGSIKCSRCEKITRAEAAYCPHCGMHLQTLPLSYASARRNIPGRTIFSPRIVLSVVGIAILSLAYFSSYRVMYTPPQNLLIHSSPTVQPVFVSPGTGYFPNHAPAPYPVYVPSPDSHDHVDPEHHEHR